MCLTAPKKVAVMLLVALILRYMGIRDNFPNEQGFLLPLPP